MPAAPQTEQAAARGSPARVAARAAVPGAERLLALQRTAGNRTVARLVAGRGGPSGRQLQREPAQRGAQPTYGNLPSHAPYEHIERFELRQVDGRWVEVPADGSMRRAGGVYPFSVEGGKIWAIHPLPAHAAGDYPENHRPGHTESSASGRSAWAGDLEIEWRTTFDPAEKLDRSGPLHPPSLRPDTGQILWWNDGSGHTRPLSGLRDVAVRAGLPADRFVQHPETRPRAPSGGGAPRRARDLLPQLPVWQEPTRSRTGEPPRIGPGGPRLAELVPAPAVTGPTYANLTLKMPYPEAPERFRLVEEGGRWFRLDSDGSRSPARRGSYPFVVQGGDIWAIDTREPGWLRPPGYADAANGLRVVWAGDLFISDDGRVISWTDAPDTYHTASSLGDNARKVGLPAGRRVRNAAGWSYERLTNSWTRKPGARVQLPVWQAETRPVAGRPLRVPPGTPRLPILERNIASGPPLLPPEAAAPGAAGPGPPTGGGSGPGAPKAPAGAAPPAAPVTPTGSATSSKGSVRTASLVLDYDLETSDRSRAVRVKSIDLAGYPPDRPGRITGFFRDREVLAALTREGGKAAGGLAADLMLDHVRSHFEGAVAEAARAFDARFPGVAEVRARAGLDVLARDYDDVIEGRAASLRRSAEENFAIASAYEDAMLETLLGLDADAVELERIFADLGKRALLLARLARELEEAMRWIHSNALGALMPVYYESFALWEVRGVILACAQRITALASVVADRDRERRGFAESLNRRLESVGEELDKTRWMFPGR